MDEKRLAGNDAAVEIRNLSKSYNGIRILNDISARFDGGLIHGIIGRNGSGKTVLLRCLCGLTRYDKGEVIVGGRIVGKEVEIPDDAGIIIETPGFLPNLSGRKNLMLLSKLRGIVGKERVDECLGLVGLSGSADKPVGKYSLGMRQRLGIAQAIMEYPHFLFLDEPLSGLDVSGVQEMRRLLLDMRDKGCTIIMVSHNAEDISVLCDTVHKIVDGELHEA